MSIKIITDSTCDLPEKTIKELDISVLPLYINVGDQGYLDGVDISRKEFYSRLPDFDQHPSTGTPGSMAFSNIFSEAENNGASEIISIHISETLSATVQVARAAATEYNGVKVHVVDSGQLSSGTGFQVELAARMAKKGKDSKEILAALEELGSRTFVAAGLSTLEFLRRSGRMNGLLTGLGTLLKLKPILTMKMGQAGSERIRTRRKANIRLVEMLKDYQPLERLAFLHTDSGDQVDVLAKEISKQIAIEPDFSVDITPVIGAHIGPGAAGFALLRKK